MSNYDFNLFSYEKCGLVWYDDIIQFVKNIGILSITIKTSKIHWCVHFAFYEPKINVSFSVYCFVQRGK